MKFLVQTNYGFQEVLLAPASPRVNDVRNQGPELLDPEALPANYQMELMPRA